MNKKHLITVLEDLEYLGTEWRDDVPRATIRRGSAVLRRLLVEREIGRAWRAVGFNKEPTIFGANLEKLIRNYDRNHLLFGLAGGAHRGVILMAAFVLSTVPLPERRFGPGESLDTMMNHPFTLSQYVESPCALIEGEMLKRGHLIKSMANIRGGVHLGNEITGQKETELHKKIARLDKKINDQVIDGLGFELLSIAQRVAQAPDIQALLTKIKESA